MHARFIALFSWEQCYETSIHQECVLFYKSGITVTKPNTKSGLKLKNKKASCLAHIHSLTLGGRRQVTPTRELRIAARHSTRSSMSVCISGTLVSPVSLFSVSIYVAGGRPLDFFPCDGSHRTSPLAVSSGCLTYPFRAQAHKAKSSSFSPWKTGRFEGYE